MHIFKMIFYKLRYKLDQVRSSSKDLYYLPVSRLNSKIASSITSIAMATTKKNTPNVMQTDLSPESSPTQ